MDIPKEVCSRQKANPRKIKRPIVKKWCYTPTQESGLDEANTETDDNDDKDDDQNEGVNDDANDNNDGDEAS